MSCHPCQDTTKTHHELAHYGALQACTINNCIIYYSCATSALFLHVREWCPVLTRQECLILQPYANQRTVCDHLHHQCYGNWIPSSFSEFSTAQASQQHALVRRADPCRPSTSWMNSTRPSKSRLGIALLPSFSLLLQRAPRTNCGCR
jgi:predicted lipoprotein with Yx(FWY)xxD motif